MDDEVNTESNDELWDLFCELKKGLDDLPDKPSEKRCCNETCDGVDFPLEDGNYSCTKCGTVQERFIDYTAEWRYYGNDDSKSSDPTRCGMPTNEFLPGMSLGSVIGMDSKTKLSNYMFKISKYQKWTSMSYKERNLYNIIETMSLKATNGGISNSIIEQAKVLYKKISELKLSRGDNREGLIASSIYTSCKKNQVPRSAKEIAKMFNLNITVLTRGRKKFDDIMNMNLKSSNPDDFIVRFCSKMDFSDEMMDIARHVVKKEEEYAIISENAPPSIAAGCIYMVNNCCQLGRAKKEISQACDVSEITINKCYKKLYEFRLHLFPEEVILKYQIE